jgi:hypothetical protein
LMPGQGFDKRAQNLADAAAYAIKAASALL